MITNILLSIVFVLISTIFSWLPVVTIASLPFIGEFVSSSLLLMVQYWNSFLITFPYASIAWNVFLIVIVPFELFMLLMRFFFGARVPTNPN